jgi:hypothetical protein
MFCELQRQRWEKINATSSLVHFENIFLFAFLSALNYLLQSWRCSCKFRSHRIGLKSILLLDVGGQSSEPLRHCPRSSVLAWFNRNLVPAQWAVHCKVKAFVLTCFHVFTCFLFRLNLFPRLYLFSFSSYVSRDGVQNLTYFVL